MSVPFDLESTQVALGWAVLHFLWQGVVIGLLAAVALALVRREDAAARHVVGLSALAICLVTFGGTFGHTLMSTAADAGPRVVLPASVDLDSPEFAAASTILAELTAVPAVPAVRAIEPTGPLAWFWTAGALFMALRLVRASFHVHRLRTRALSPVDTSWQRVLDGLCGDLGIRRAVRLLKSELIDSPAVVGWLAPLILVPATTFTALTPEQLRAVLAHELAHIRRYDHLANALQALIEVLLFFHPVVWWLSRLVREEREHCCDSAAVQTAGSSLLLAQALTRLESLRLTNPSIALAAKTHRGSLMNRITRILDSRTGVPQRPIGWRLLSSLSAGVLVLGLGVAQAAPEVSAEPVVTGAVSPQTRDAKADYAIIEARILSAIEAGELSAKDAKTTLAALRRTMFPTLQGGVAGVTGRYVRLPSRNTEMDPRSRYSAAEKKARAAVKAGKISGEDARKRLTEYRIRLGEEARRVDPREEPQGDEIKRYLEAQKKIKEAVKAGRISKEDGERRLIGQRRALGEKERGADVATDLHTRYAGAEKKIKAAVKAGDLSREDAEKKLEGLRRRIAMKAKELEALRAAEKKEKKERRR